MNPAEYHWEDLRDFLRQHCTDLPNFENLTLSDMINAEPVLVAYYFDRRFRTFFTKVILNKNGPFGKVRAYFWRRESQCPFLKNNCNCNSTHCNPGLIFLTHISIEKLTDLEASKNEFHGEVLAAL